MSKLSQSAGPHPGSGTAGTAKSGGSYRLQIELPDLRPWQAGNCGIPYVWRFDGAGPGPFLWVNALLHGNELCGAWALDRLLSTGIRPRRGTLALSFANVAAFERRPAGETLGLRFLDEDMNRLWDRLDGPGGSTELDRARALRPLADRADVLLDLHAMTHATEPLFLTGLVEHREKQEQARALATRIGVPSLLVADCGHRAGRRLRDYAPFTDPASGQVALIVECGGWWERRSVDIAIETVRRTLLALDLLDAGDLDGFGGLDEPTAPVRVVEATHTVTIATDAFRFAGNFRGNEVIPRAGTIIAFDGPQPVVTPYDDCFLLFPTTHPARGTTAVRLGRFSCRTT
jgi:predicted deacylase